jgi:hypothetical protein
MIEVVSAKYRNKEKMMTKRQTGFTLVILGTVLQVISIYADHIGLGEYPDIFGWKQMFGAGLGLVMILIGVWLVSRRTDSPVN